MWQVLFPFPAVRCSGQNDSYQLPAHQMPVDQTKVAISLRPMRPYTTTQTSPRATAQTSPGHRRRTQLLVLIAILTQVMGNVFLSHGMRRAGAIISASPFDYLRALNPWALAGICALA